MLATLRDLITALMLLAAMVLAGVIGRTQGRGIVILVLLSLVWLTVDRNWEGPVLFAIDDTHGVVVADLAGGAGLLAAGRLMLRRRR